MRTSVFFICSAVLIGLSACATYTEGSQQQITFETPSAENAVCEVRTGVNELVYRVRPPQTVWVKKSRKDMKIICEAPGNRIAEQTVKSTLSSTTFGNVANGILPGVVYDGESGAMFKYPDLIQIDFAGITAKMNPMPDYHNLDGLQPVNEVEDYGPSVPKGAGDLAEKTRHQSAWDEFHHEESAAAALEAEKQNRINSLEGGFYGDKGNTGNK